MASLDLAERLLDSGDPEGARPPLASARASQEAVARTLDWMPQIEPHTAEFLSVVKVRVRRVRTESDAQTEHSSPAFRAYARAIGIFSRLWTIDVEIVEAAIVGRAFQPGSIRSRRHPERRRRDLVPGKQLELRVQASKWIGVETCRDGQEFWLVLAPPFTGHSLIPHVLGSEGGRSEVELALARIRP
jgi:hypothetical protein